MWNNGMFGQPPGMGQFPPGMGQFPQQPMGQFPPQFPPQGMMGPVPPPGMMGQFPPPGMMGQFRPPMSGNIGMNWNMPQFQQQQPPPPPPSSKLDSSTPPQNRPRAKLPPLLAKGNNEQPLTLPSQPPPAPPDTQPPPPPPEPSPVTPAARPPPPSEKNQPPPPPPGVEDRRENQGMKPIENLKVKTVVSKLSAPPPPPPPPDKGEEKPAIPSLMNIMHDPKENRGNGNITGWRGGRGISNIKGSGRGFNPNLGPGGDNKSGRGRSFGNNLDRGNGNGFRGGRGFDNGRGFWSNSGPGRNDGNSYDNTQQVPSQMNRNEWGVSEYNQEEYGNEEIFEQNDEYDQGFSCLEHSEEREEGSEKVFGIDPQSEEKLEDWPCSSGCGEVNFAWRTECRSCGYPKQTFNPATSNIKEGDWQCSQCKEVNFAKREKCKKCNLSKGETGPEFPFGNNGDNNQWQDQRNNQQFHSDQRNSGELSQPFQQDLSSHNDAMMQNNNKLGNFDKMFKDWETKYEDWKISNKNNPDREYVETYMSQMEAMRMQLLEKRKSFENPSMETFNPATKMQAKMLQNWNNQSETKVIEKRALLPSPKIDDKRIDQDKGKLTPSEIAKKMVEAHSYDSDDGIDSKQNDNAAMPMKKSRWENEGQDENLPQTENRWNVNSDQRDTPKRSRWEADSERPDTFKKSRWDKQVEQADQPAVDNNEQPKKSRWEIDASEVVDMKSWRRSPQRNETDRMRGISSEEMDGRFTTPGRSNFQQNPKISFEIPAGNEFRGNSMRMGLGRKSAMEKQQESDFSTFWKPTAVKDYSTENLVHQQSKPEVQCDFKPQTFDYSHGAAGTGSNDAETQQHLVNSPPPWAQEKRNSPQSSEGGFIQKNNSYSPSSDQFVPWNEGNISSGEQFGPGRGRFGQNARGFGRGRGSFNRGTGGMNNNFRAFHQSTHMSNTNFQGKGQFNNQEGMRNPRFNVEEERPVAPKMAAGNRVMIDSIISPPGRNSRPPRLVIIFRGLPGAGKTHIARLIKEKEVEQGSEPPRTMALDDYFDCDGEYTYEQEMEPTYRVNFIKSFKKNVDGGYFPFIIVDAVHQEVDHFRDMWSHAKQNGFEVYVCDVECDAAAAADRNVHGRTGKEVMEMAKRWEPTPPHMNTLDVRALLQDDAIEHVDMDEATDDVEEKVEVSPKETEDEEAEDQSFLKASKWEILDKEEKMARLDGTTEKIKARLAEHDTIEDWLELGEDTRPQQEGKKRVRWADLEQRKAQRKAKQLGFVVGQTNWASQQDADKEAKRALASTKIIPNRFHSEFHI